MNRPARSLKLTRDDCIWLRNLHIDPEEGPEIGPLSGGANWSMKGGRIAVTGSMARLIIKQYGELNWDTFTAYISGGDRGRERGSNYNGKKANRHGQ